MWFWIANVPIALCVIVFDPPLWRSLALPYLVFVSLWANTAAHLAGFAADD